MKSKISTLLGIQYPVIQGAMAWIADSSLASAVSNAGGLGIIASGNAPVDMVRDEIRKTKLLTDKPFGVNIMLLSPYADDIAQLVCDEDIKVVTTGAGSPGKYIDAFKQKNIKILPVVASVALARMMEKTGADALIAEGMEAGGHIGKLTTFALLPQVVSAVSIPVIGAGGIGDGRGFAAALMLGAEGVQVGTRFLVAKECTVHENFKKAIIKARDIDTTITGSFTGHPVRVLKNKLSKKMEKFDRADAENDETNLKLFNEIGQGALRKAVVEGDVDNGSVMAGQIAGLVNKEQTCAEILNELVVECDNTIKGHIL